MKKLKIGFLATILLVTSSCLVTGAVLLYYGQIMTTANVEQSILLDGKDINSGSLDIIDVIDEQAPGGERFCFKHTLSNLMSVEGEVFFLDNCSGTDLQKNPINCTGVKTSYYDLSDHRLEPIKEGYNGSIGSLFNFVDLLGWNPLKITKSHDTECNLIIILDMPREIGEAPDNFDLVFDKNIDGIPDFLVHWHYDMSKDPQGNSHWTWKEYYGNYQWGNAQELPDWIHTYSNSTGEIFTIKIDSDKLGNNNGRKDDCGLPYIFGLQTILSGQGSEKVGVNQVNIYFPYSGLGSQMGNYLNFFSSEDYKEEEFGIETTGMKIKSKKSDNFCVCYEFEENIMPGTYKITTDIVPPNQMYTLDAVVEVKNKYKPTLVRINEYKTKFIKNYNHTEPEIKGSPPTIETEWPPESGTYGCENSYGHAFFLQWTDTYGFSGCGEIIMGGWIKVICSDGYNVTKSWETHGSLIVNGYGGVYSEHSYGHVFFPGISPGAWCLIEANALYCSFKPYVTDRPHLTVIAPD